MKKLLLLLSGMLLLISIHISAQSKGSYISLGPVAGFGHSWLPGFNKQVFKPSAYLGIGLIYSRYEHWGWGGDVIASHEGFSARYPFHNDITTVDPTYIRVTPKAYYFFGKYGTKVRPKIYVGPSLGVKVAEDHYNDKFIAIDNLGSNDNSTYNPEFKNIDFGVVGGIGVNIKLAKYIWLNMDVSGYQGFLWAYNEIFRNANTRFNAGVMFGIH